MTHYQYCIIENTIHYIKPNDPAVIPTVTKNPNSTISLEPGGSDAINSASGIIEVRKINRLCMQLLRLLLRKLVDTFFLKIKIITPTIRSEKIHYAPAGA